eukprot:scaffold5884_cov403-Prasinococcus_capsulatus_cf.AAC.3
MSQPTVTPRLHRTRISSYLRGAPIIQDFVFHFRFTENSPKRIRYYSRRASTTSPTGQLCAARPNWTRRLALVPAERLGQRVDTDHSPGLGVNVVYGRHSRKT